jgi:hypothetical protein
VRLNASRWAAGLGFALSSYDGPLAFLLVGLAAGKSSRSGLRGAVVLAFGQRVVAGDQRPSRFGEAIHPAAP